MPYEWGNPVSRFTPVSQSDATLIARPAHYWRINRSQGPFHRMRVLFKLTGNKDSVFKHWLEIGGGEVVPDE